MQLITSQRHRDEGIVAEKQAAKDYTVTLGKVITIDGADYRVVVDGHHSHEAAIRDGVAPEYIDATEQMSDREGIEDVTEYLAVHEMDDEWYDIATGETIWA